MIKRTTVFLTILFLLFSFNFLALESVKSFQYSSCGQCIEYFPNGDRVIAGNKTIEKYYSYRDWYNGLKGAFFVAILDQYDGALKTSYSFYGNGASKVVDMAVTESNFYLIANTTSTNLPQNRNLAQPTYNIDEHKEKAYIVCFTKDLQIVWSSYFGGNKKDLGSAIKIDSNGDLRVLLTVQSQNLPVFLGEPSTCNKNEESHRILYLATISKDGKQVLRSTYLNRFNAIGYSMDIDKNDNIFIAGSAFNKDITRFKNPSTIPKCGSYGFVSMFDKNYIKIWATLLSDTVNIDSNLESYTSVFSVAVDNKEIFVTGATTSQVFPITTNVIQNKAGGKHEAFICSLSYVGDIVWSTYYGGTADVFGLKILPGKSGNLIVCGFVKKDEDHEANDSFFNMQNSYQNALEGNNAFVAAISSNGENIHWSTLYGGSDTEIIYDFALNPYQGTMSLVGGTSSSYIPFFGETDNCEMNMLLITDNELGHNIDVRIIY
ncbi:MAG: hypothetical protein KAH01_06140 [Caldisericia bacterium]|nr:hypothetical protein [Caldisericia bacterium]